MKIEDVARPDELEDLPDNLYEEAVYWAHGLSDRETISSELFDELTTNSEFCDDMPYGFMRQRDGMPEEWIVEKLVKLLGPKRHSCKKKAKNGCF